METVFIICAFVILFGLLMILASIFTPRTAWFSKNKTRIRGALTWLAVVILAAIVGTAIITKPKDSETAPAPTVSNTAPDPAAPATVAEEVKRELAALLREAEAMGDLGQVASDWEMRLKDARDRFEHNESLPRPIRMVPLAIFSLGQNYLRLKTEDLDEGPKAALEANIKTDLEEIKAALNWTDEPDADAETEKAAASAASEDANSKFTPEVLAARKAITARAEEVKPKLAALLRELEAMRNTRQFRELGFSAKNHTATHWKKRVEETEERLKADDNLPAEVKIVPAVLLSLGLDYVGQNKGADKKSDIEYDLELIRTGLDWKWDD